MKPPSGSIHAREPQAGERTDKDPPRTKGPARGDSRPDGSLPKGPEAKLGPSAPGMKSPGQVITACTVPGTAAVTFDDGPYLYTEEIIRILKENGAVGTFFFNGQNFGCINEPSNAARVKAAYDAGHQVASHTWSHKDLATLPQDEITSEMSAVTRAFVSWSKYTQAIKDITGVTPAFMRPPYGSYNDDVLEVAAKIGQDVALWNVDSGDSVGVAPGESQSRYDQAIQQKLPILALNHETHETTVNDVLPSVLKKLKDAGYRLVSVAECVGKEPYLKDAPALPSVSHSSR
ncbi:Chitin deacetylase [Leucoagaricus sp. SymC.cos]|nr:Chitin deacetylase [Leucoagaricus sp. SymC.cos]